jgi:hypothetical protein
MRATVHDPSGPLWTRLVVPALGGLCIASGLLWAWLDGAAPGAELYVGLSVMLLAPFVVGRHAPRRARIELGHGCVFVCDAGVLDQTISARAVEGASTSITPSGAVALALARSWRAGRPIFLELDSEADATRIRDALGVGHHGFGALGWPARASVTHRVLAVLRIAAAALALLVAWRVAVGGDLPSIAALFPFLFALPFAWAFAANADRESRIELSPLGVRYFEWNRWQFVPYVEIIDVKDTEAGITLRRGAGDPTFLPAPRVKHGRRGLTVAEREHIVAQIRNAARRARGEGPPEPDMAASTLLASRADENARTWLERLDATARTIADGAGYRGLALSELDLWNAVQNHDADPEVRAGAARVLVRVEGGAARARIETIIAAVRDDLSIKRIRIATGGDVDEASRELESIEEIPANARRL